jgi:Uma2 family endonuclease
MVTSPPRFCLETLLPGYGILYLRGYRRRNQTLAVEKTRFTSQEFWDFVNLPENADRFFDRVDGETIEYMPSNPYSSAVAALIVYFLTQFVREHKIAGYVTGADGGYDVTDEDTFAPDVAFISKARAGDPAQGSFNPIAP